MSLLQHKKAQVLLADARLSAVVVDDCMLQLTTFLERYLPQFCRAEQRELARVVVQGKLSGLERKTSEPIAVQAGRHRKPVQHFVGGGKWDDEAVQAELRRHVAQAWADPEGVLVLDSSSFPKKGDASCGVARQWCGRLGKLDNCQVGVFAAYACRSGHAPLDRRLYLPQEWATDPRRRKQCHVPREVRFQTKCEIALDLLAGNGDLAHAWVAADEEFGRNTAFRQALRRRRERYVLDVPSNTLVRELGGAARHARKPSFERAQAWAARQPASRWQRIVIRAGEKGRLVVRALAALVQTKDEEGHVGRAERLLVMRPVEQSGDRWYALSNAPADVPLAELVRVKSERHRIEEVFQEAKGEVGLAHYEARSWVGWHHHMTLSLLALWFLTLERQRLGGKSSRLNRSPTTPRSHTPAGTRAHGRGHRLRNHADHAA